jgi:toxin ParE1/3/4
MMQLLISPLAAQDIEDVGDFIARDNPLRALSFVLELHKQCLRISANPLGYRKRPELGADMRSCAYGNYVIFFESLSDAVKIVRVLHGARDIDAAVLDD